MSAKVTAAMTAEIADAMSITITVVAIDATAAAMSVTGT